MKISDTHLTDWLHNELAGTDEPLKEMMLYAAIDHVAKVQDYDGGRAMNPGTYNGWLDTYAFTDLTWKAAKHDIDRIGADQQLMDLQADAAFDAGFEAGVEAQKNGLGEIPLS